MILNLRQGVPDDRRFIFSTWLLSSRQYLKHITWEQRRAAVQALVDACAFTVVYPNQDRDIILGWAARLGGALMWVYVQKDARGNGIAQRLENEVHRPDSVP